MSDVSTLLDRKGIKYSIKGNDALIFCLNPEHEDSSPSCRVDLTTGQYHCFSCGFGGKNIFEYFLEYYNPVILEANELQAKISNMIIDISGIDIPESASEYTGDHRGIPPELYKKYEAFQHPKFGENRISFPIKDMSGKVVNIISRSLFTKVPPKYKMYPPDRPSPIYPVTPGPYAVLVEGIYDMLNLEQHGMTNVSCLFGTSTITNNNVHDKINPLMVLGVHTLFLLLDNDDAGNSRAEFLKRCIEKRLGLRVVILNGMLPYDTDPGELKEEEVAIINREIKKLIY
jgi:DNA primase